MIVKAYIPGHVQFVFSFCKWQMEKENKSDRNNKSEKGWKWQKAKTTKLKMTKLTE